MKPKTIAKRIFLEQLLQPKVDSPKVFRISIDVLAFERMEHKEAIDKRKMQAIRVLDISGSSRNFSTFLSFPYTET